jgi:hypothetical protein
MLRTEAFLKIFLLMFGVFFLFAGQSGASDVYLEIFDSDAKDVCLLCHRKERTDIYNQWSESPLGKAGVNCTLRRLEYSESHLVRNLLKIGYPLYREDVIALDITGMKFDYKNRIKLLEKILLDRDFIHNRKDINYFSKTEVILDALRLLDEHDLPVANKLIDELNKQGGWEKREKALLASMAAKRDIRYQSNAAYLLSMLPKYASDLDGIYSGESFLAIIDAMSYLSYLADLSVYKGDKDILNSLFIYTSRAHGFPAEYLSHKFVEILLLRPKVFISTLATKDDQTVNSVTNSLYFGIRNNQVREKVKGVLQKNLFTTDELNQRSIDSITDHFKPFN